MMKTVIVSVNPKAGRRNSQQRVDRFVHSLENSYGFSVEVMTDLAAVAARANELHASGDLRALVGVGGDGTAAELTNRTVDGVPISLLASGTANLLAKHLRYSNNPEKMAKIIAEGDVVPFDTATANGRLFLAMVGCGFDAEVVRQVHTARMSNPKGAHINYCSYIKPVFRAIAGYRYPSMRVEVLDDAGNTTEQIEGPWVFISNIPRYGWGIPLAPKAKGDDGVLDLCVYKGKSLFGGLALTIAAQLGGAHRYLPKCTMVQGKRFRVTAVDEGGLIPYQLDGDPASELPLDVEIVPNRLTLIVPKRK